MDIYNLKRDAAHLKSALGDMDRKAISEELAKRTGSQLIEIRGSSAVLYRK